MYLVTGSAGFIGFHVCLNLLEKKKKVIGIDNLNKYYDVNLKKKRNSILKKHKNFKFLKLNIIDTKKIHRVFYKYKIKYVIHLAAQAGVRYSIQFPEKYIDTNLKGFFNIIENSKKKNIKHFLYASTSSVYGNNQNYPLREDFSASHPMSIYAATKRSNELIAHSYSSLFNLPTTGLRFFTAYGPWGRPDMALFKFTKNILKNKKISVFNNGNHQRDFTYIDDIVKCIELAINKIPKKDKLYNPKKPNPKLSYCPYRIINIGGNNPTNLEVFIKLIEKNLNKKSRKKYLKLQKGDVIKTQSSLNWSYKLLKYKPSVKPTDGIKFFLNWYKDYYKIKY